MNHPVIVRSNKMMMITHTESARRMLFLTLIVTFLHLQLVFSKKVVVKYFGEDYLVDGGCKAKDETVLK